MRVGEICDRNVVTAELDESVLDVARSMRLQGVREVLVVGREGGRRRPLGVLTDRSIVVDLLAREIDLKRAVVAEVMDRDLLLLHEDEELPDALAALRSTRQLWLPVVNGLGDLVGRLGRDDLLEILGEQLSALLSLSGDGAGGSGRDETAVAGRMISRRPPMD